MKYEDKISKSIELLRNAERLALKMQPDKGFFVAFSGGKDSQVLLRLVQLAGVKYHAVYSVVTLDRAENIRFLRKCYSEVEFSAKNTSILRLIEKKGLPTRAHRWCCERFKEVDGAGFVVLTGIRAEESRKRAKYTEVMKRGKAKKDSENLDLAEMEANEFRCVGGKDKIMVYPILEWSEAEVWRFLREQNLPINPCYEKDKRVGCSLCPFASRKQNESFLAAHPRFKKVLLAAIGKYLQKSEGSSKLDSAEEVLDWWLSGDSINDYMSKKRQLKMDF